MCLQYLGLLFQHYNNDFNTSKEYLSNSFFYIYFYDLLRVFCISRSDLNCVNFLTHKLYVIQNRSKTMFNQNTVFRVNVNHKLSTRNLFWILLWPQKKNNAHGRIKVIRKHIINFNVFSEILLWACALL